MKKSSMYFLTGQSGAGKDTAARRLKKYLKEKGIKFLYVSVGDSVRRTAKSGKEFGKRMHEVNVRGDLQPDTIPIYYFLRKFERNYEEGMIIIVNGAGRRRSELYEWKKYLDVRYIPETITVLNIEAPDEVCLERIRKRKGFRPETSSEESLKRKMDSYLGVRGMLRQKLPAGFSKCTIDATGTRNQVFEQVKAKIDADLGIAA